MKSSNLYGLHAAQAALANSPEKITKAWVDAQRTDQRLGKIVDELAALNLVPEKVDKKRLDRLAEGNIHQGIVLAVTLPAERPESDLKDAVLGLDKTALFLVLDNVQDPHNLGACLRTADATGVDGVIITKDNAACITATVCKVASGAAETIPVYQVTNLARTLRWLKEQGIWIVGAVGEAGQTVYQTDLTMPLALVIGAEGSGMRRLTKEQCDFLVKLPMLGQVESLNLSVATGVLLYEVVRQRQSRL
jgi:23S rRNA (guanosine2251-2'-O)-methyltransferase